tara:strand:- start:1160 stop:1396 length:237 start_codon:yes stop_codon:yes gene_type:complete
MLGLNQNLGRKSFFPEPEIQRAVSKNKKLQLVGWIYFILSSLFYIASSIRVGDLLSTLGGIFFFGACLVFLFQLLTED